MASSLKQGEKKKDAKEKENHLGGMRETGQHTAKKRKGK